MMRYNMAKGGEVVRVILSPAKKMRVDTDSLAWRDLPQFLPKTEKLLQKLQTMGGKDLQALWACSDKIAVQNIERLQNMSLTAHLTPAVLCYEGLAYQHMAPNVFTAEQLSYVQQHLRILSGFYGILRPFDGVTPYRLEMQARLSVDGCCSLYDFWGADLAEQLEQETDTILNLASNEYSKAVEKHLSDKTRFITCIFGEWDGGKVAEKGTECKMARGEMVRFLAEKQADSAEAAKNFCCLKFRFADELSDSDHYVFEKEK